MPTILEFPVASSTNPSDIAWIIQSGASKQVTLSTLFSGLQSTNAQLTAIAAISTTGALQRSGGTFSTFTFTDYAKTLVAAVDATAALTVLGVSIPSSGNATSGQLVKGNDTRLTDARAPLTHTHPNTDVTGLGTAALLSVPSSGDATSGQVVKGNDTRLTNSRAPSVHASTHSVAGTDPLTPGTIGAANATHTHANTDITGLGTMSTQSSSSVAITGGTISAVGTGLTALTAANITASTTAGRNILNVTNPGAISFLKIGADNTVTTRTPAQVRSDIGAGVGGVISVSVTSSNGVSGSVATATTTPDITIVLGAINPASVNGITFAGDAAGSYPIDIRCGSSATLQVGNGVAATITTFGATLTGSASANAAATAITGGTAPIADGTYTLGIGVTTNGIITVVNGLIMSIQQAS